MPPVRVASARLRNTPAAQSRRFAQGESIRAEAQDLVVDLLGKFGRVSTFQHAGYQLVPIFGEAPASLPKGPWTDAPCPHRRPRRSSSWAETVSVWFAGNLQAQQPSPSWIRLLGPVVCTIHAGSATPFTLFLR